MKVRAQIPTAENSTNMNGFGVRSWLHPRQPEAAIGGETGASAKYTAFAKAAKEQGYDQIARLFEGNRSRAEQIPSAWSTPGRRHGARLREARSSCDCSGAQTD